MKKTVFGGVVLLAAFFLTTQVFALPPLTETAKARRQGIFSATAEQLGFQPTEENPNVWSIVMETAYPQSFITFVAALGGNANVYFGNGGTITGAGTDPVVMEANQKLFKEAEKIRKKFKKTPKQILFPDLGQAKFYLFTFSDGILTAEAEEVEIKDGDHRLSPLYLAAQEVLEAIRGAVE